MNNTDVLIKYLELQRETMALKRSLTQMTLGKLIDELSQYPPDAKIQSLGEPMSYRGYYSDLAFEPSDEVTTVSNVRDMAIACIGKVFEGYKGGDFEMGLNTPVWVSPYGCGGGDRIMGISNGTDKLTFILKPEELGE